VAVKSLLAAGASVDAMNRHDWTPLLLAARFDRARIVQELVPAGATVAFHGFHGWTALHIARRYGYVEVSEMLVEAGADEDVCDNDGVSAREAGLREKCWGAI
jgi:uncharacterized protein